MGFISSGLTDYMDVADNCQKVELLHKDFVLSVLTKEKRHQRRIYRQFVRQDDSEEITQLFEKRAFQYTMV